MITYTEYKKGITQDEIKEFLFWLDRKMKPKTRLKDVYIKRIPCGWGDWARAYIKLPSWIWNNPKRHNSCEIFRVWYAMHELCHLETGPRGGNHNQVFKRVESRWAKKLGFRLDYSQKYGKMNKPYPTRIYSLNGELLWSDYKSDRKKFSGKWKEYKLWKNKKLNISGGK